MSILRNLFKFSQLARARHKDARCLSTTIKKLGNIEDEVDNIFDREFVDMKVEDFKKLYETDKTGETKKKIEVVLKEYEYIKYNSLGRVPSVIDEMEMDRFIKEGYTPSLRDKLFNFFYKRELAKHAGLRRKEREKAEKQSRKDKKLVELRSMSNTRSGILNQHGDIIYGLWHNSLFCRIPDNRLKSGNSASRLKEAAMWGRKLVFDFAFEEFMPGWIYKNSLEQVQCSYGLNRYNYKEPFDFWFCNFKKDSIGHEFFVEKAMKNLYTGAMVTVKEDCFMNHFDKSRLVYLSPNATQTVQDIANNDDVYIVGVYNDKGSQKPLTYRKAELLGIRSARLPIDDHLSWHVGSKSLCINHVVGSLLEVIANGGNWRSALLKHIPERKIKSLDQVVEIEEKRKNKFKKDRRFSLRNDFDWD